MEKAYLLTDLLRALRRCIPPTLISVSPTVRCLEYFDASSVRIREVAARSALQWACRLISQSEEVGRFRGAPAPE